MNDDKRSLYLHIVGGFLLGVLLLHPLTKTVYWFEFHREFQADVPLWNFLADRLQSHLFVEMLPMSLVFGFIGAVIGAGFGIYHLRLSAQHLAVRRLVTELGRDILSLIAAGENEQTEFKSSVRWDVKRARVNKALEMVIAKTIAGFMNHIGGSLLVGVDDDGQILGLENDYKSLKHKNRDGFEQCLIDIVKARLGGDKCRFLHVAFSSVEEKDVCRIVVEPAGEPVYCNDGGVAKYCSNWKRNSRT